MNTNETQLLVTAPHDQECLLDHPRHKEETHYLTRAVEAYEQDDDHVAFMSALGNMAQAQSGIR